MKTAVDDVQFPVLYQSTSPACEFSPQITLGLVKIMGRNWILVKRPPFYDKIKDILRMWIMVHILYPILHLICILDERG